MFSVTDNLGLLENSLKQLLPSDIRILINGANGWLGKNVSESLWNIFKESFSSQVLLTGSKDGILQMQNGYDLKIHRWSETARTRGRFQGLIPCVGGALPHPPRDGRPRRGSRRNRTRLPPGALQADYPPRVRLPALHRGLRDPQVLRAAARLPDDRARARAGPLQPGNLPVYGAPG